MDKLNYKITFFISIVIITLGISFNSIFKESVSSLGTVFIAVGVLFLIISMAKKRKENESKNNN